MVGQQASEILSLPLQHWDYIHVLYHVICIHAWAGYVCLVATEDRKVPGDLKAE